MPGGRPTKYKPEYCDQARKLCLLGATDKQIADFFSVNIDTITEWKNKYPEFSVSLKEAKEDFDTQIERSLAQRALGYKHEAVKIMQYEGEVIEVPYTEHYAPDTTACIFWLKNRQPQRWRDKTEHEVTVTSNIADRLKQARERKQNAING